MFSNILSSHVLFLPTALISREAVDKAFSIFAFFTESLSIPAALAPVKAAILPLVKKDGLPELAHEIKNLLKFDHNIQYDEKDSIGKRYRRQDAIGTPLCITVDYQTREDRTVTVRHRDSMEQHRVAIDELPALVNNEVSLRKLFQKII